MGTIGPQFHALFLLFLFLNSGSGAVEQKKILGNSEKAKLQLSSTFVAQRDTTPGTIPIINPTTPGTMTPLVGSASPLPPTTMTSPPTTTGSSGAWCIAKPSASSTALQVALDYACGYGGTDCSAIQSGASCYDPNTIQDHASYAFNNYYQKNPIPTSCDFGGTAQLTYSDPSHGNCHYASATSTTMTTPANPPPTTPANPPPTTPSPMILSPPSPGYLTPTTTVPGPPTVYGVAEPTGSPSSATSVRCSLLIVLITTGLLGSVLTATGS